MDFDVKLIKIHVECQIDESGGESWRLLLDDNLLLLGGLLLGLFYHLFALFDVFFGLATFLLVQPLKLLDVLLKKLLVVAENVQNFEVARVELHQSTAFNAVLDKLRYMVLHADAQQPMADLIGTF